MIIPTAKIKAILLYFSNNTNIKFLGKIKLMKLFYFLDFEHIREYGSPVTFDTYYHLEKGPIPSYIMNLIDGAIDDGKDSILSDTVAVRTPRGTRMNQFVPLRKFTDRDSKMFSESELKTLEKVCKRFNNATMEQIKEASHKEAPWSETKMAQPIPYSLAAKDSSSKFTAEEIEFSVKIAE